MDILTPNTVPVVFVAIAVVFGVNWLRGRTRPGPAQGIAQRNRARMAIIFGLIGVGLLLWQAFERG